MILAIFAMIGMLWGIGYLISKGGVLACFWVDVIILLISASIEDANAISVLVGIVLCVLFDILIMRKAKSNVNNDNTTTKYEPKPISQHTIETYKAQAAKEDKEYNDWGFIDFGH